MFSELRFRLLLLVVLTCAPLAGLTLHTAWEDRRRAVTDWARRSQDLMQLASREEQELIGGTRQLLLAIAESSSVRLGNRRGCKELLGEVLRSYPRYANFGVLQTNEMILASAVEPRAATTPAEQEFFRRALSSRAFVIGDFPAGSLNDQPRLNFGCPIFDRLGRFQGVVFAGLDLAWFSRFGSELPAQLPKEATWTEMDGKGRTLVRYPSGADSLEENLSFRIAERERNNGPLAINGPLSPPAGEREGHGRLNKGDLLKTFLDKKTGVVEAAGPGRSKMFYAFATRHSELSRGTVVTLLGIPKPVLFGEADRALFRNLAWFGIAAAMALGAGWAGSNLLVLRPVKALVHSSARLTSGDLSARTGLPHGRDELGQLTLTFDTMANALEQRELERVRSSEKLRVLSHRLVEAQETERREIARELHDEIGQSLTVAEMNLQAALKSPRAAALTRRLEESIQAVARVLEQVHDLSLNLRPSMLDDLGLEPAVRWYTHRQASLGGLTAKVKVEALEHRLETSIETGCFRVAQEALTNVVRHARAQAVTVNLTVHDGQLRLSVRDDGVGFDVAAMREEAVRGGSLGLLSMEERAALAGGGLTCVSSPGSGTEVQAWFPLRWSSFAEPMEDRSSS
jgi:signal transduction histidine kinase